MNYTLPTITKLTPTTEIHPALGKIFIIELSNGERFQMYAEEFINMYCYDEGYLEEKVDRLMENNFQELLGEQWWG